MPIKEHIPDNRQTNLCFPQTVIWTAIPLENIHEEVENYYIINNVIYYIPKYLYHLLLIALMNIEIYACMKSEGAYK
jgi:hypothetical protein